MIFLTGNMFVVLPNNRYKYICLCLISSNIHVADFISDMTCLRYFLYDIWYKNLQMSIFCKLPVGAVSWEQIGDNWRHRKYFRWNQVLTRCQWEWEGCRQNSLWPPTKSTLVTISADVGWLLPATRSKQEQFIEHQEHVIIHFNIWSYAFLILVIYQTI